MTSDAYGHAHQARRRDLIAKAINTPCPLCGRRMLRGEALDLDHSTPVVIDRHSRGDRIVHAGCNRSSGGTLGQSRWQLRPSRAW